MIIYLEFHNYNLVSILMVSILFFILFYNIPFSGDHHKNDFLLNHKCLN